MALPRGDALGVLGHSCPGCSGLCRCGLWFTPALWLGLQLGAGTGHPPSPVGPLWTWQRHTEPGHSWGPSCVYPLWSQAPPQKPQLLLAGWRDICATLVQGLLSVPEARHHPQASEGLAGRDSVCWECVALGLPSLIPACPLQLVRLGTSLALTTWEALTSGCFSRPPCSAQAMASFLLPLHPTLPPWHDPCPLTLHPWVDLSVCPRRL